MLKKELKIEENVNAKLGGRFVLEDEDGITKYLYMYHVPEDRKYENINKDTMILAPISAWKHKLGTKPLFESGYQNIVLPKEVWNKIRVADEIEYYDEKKQGFISNITQELIEKANFEEKNKKEADKKMSENNSTFSMIKNASLKATKSVAASEANEVISTNIKKGLKMMGIQSEFLDSAGGQQLIKFLGPVIVDYFARSQEETINKMLGNKASLYIREGCQLATEETLKDVIGPLVKFLIPTLKELASMGMTAMGDNSILSEESEVDKVFSKEKVNS